MFQYGALAEGLRIEHQHADGSWSPMEPEDAHDPADRDPEREWERGHVYVCDCGEAVRVMGPAESDAGEPAGAA
jgi:hypothetical protein